MAKKHRKQSTMYTQEQEDVLVYNNWAYLPPVDKDKKSIEEYTEQVEELILQTYATSMHTFTMTVNDATNMPYTKRNEFHKGLIENALYNFNRLIRIHGEEILPIWVCLNPNEDPTTYIRINRGSAKLKRSIVVHFIGISETDKDIIATPLILYRINGSASVQNPIYTPIATGSNMTEVKKIVARYRERGRELTVDQLLRAISFVSDELLKHFDDKGSKTYIDHTDYEMQYIWKYFHHYATVASENKIYPSPDCMGFSVAMTSINPESRSKFDSYYPEMVDIAFHIRERNIPILQFNNKEKDFIQKYIDEHFSDDDGSTFDLIPYLKDPRYGEFFKVPGTYDTTGEESYMFSFYILDEENKRLRYVIGFVSPDEKYCSFAFIDFDNIDRFNFHDNAVTVATDILYFHGEDMPNSYADVVEDVPKNLIDVNEISDIVFDQMATQIVIHDRPKRSRMVSCEKVVHPESKKSGKKKETPESNVVIRRILMTDRDAKEFVEKMTKEGTTKDVQYTLESWERIGHWRRVPNSDRQVYIPATTCHRHLPLSEKEIHIKL